MNVKSLIYLSLGAEACRTFHQRNPHTRIDRCTTNELVHELTLTFTRPRNITFDRIQLFKAQQQPNKSLETFYSRLREAGSHCRFEHLEEDIIKYLFISNMNNTAIQMDLLSEVRTPQQVLNYAINRERGQANQQEILRANSTSTWNQVTYIGPQAILPTPQSGKIEPCWKCGNPFTPNNLQNCPARNTICKICKKQGHFSSMCKAPMPERRRPPQQSTSSPQSRYQNIYTPRPGNNQTRRVRHIKDNTDQMEAQNFEGDLDQPEEVDAEAAIYIKELTEDWANLILIRPTTFHTEKKSVINNEGTGEFWVATTTNNKRIVWLADTGSPEPLWTKKQQMSYFSTFQKPKLSHTKNKKNSNASTTNKSNNIIGRDILRKLGITLTASKNTGKKALQISDTSIESNIIKWILKKYPKLCTRLGKSKNHIAKPTMKENFKPVQQKGRRLPLHLLDKVEAELEKLIQDKQIIRLDKCSDEHFICPVVITVKHDKSVKFALDSKKLNDAIQKKQKSNAKHRSPNRRSSKLHLRKETKPRSILL